MTAPSTPRRCRSPVGAAACARRELGLGEKVEREARGSPGEGQRWLGRGAVAVGARSRRGSGARAAQEPGGSGGECREWPLRRALLRGAQQACLAPEA